MIYKSFFCIFLFIHFLSFIDSSLQTKFIKRHAVVNYDRISLRNKHSRVQRSVENHITLVFEALQRNFNIKLKPSDKNFFETETIDFGDVENLKLDKIINYEGRLVDEPHTSYVFGSINDDMFIGVINTNNGKYFIEPANRYSNTTESHSIIYHENDVILNDELKNAKKQINKMLKDSDAESYYQDEVKEQNQEIKEITCGLNDEKVKREVEKEQSKFATKLDHNKEDLMYKYTQEANEKHSARHKRQTGQLPFPSSKSVCGLYLISDPFYYDKIYNNEGRKDATITVNYIRNYFNTYVATLNSVFSPIKFYTDSTKTSYYTGVQFKIFKTKIITFDQCNNPSSTLTDSEKTLCLSNLDVSTFLSNAALQNYDSYCLAFTFTARDFSNGALGLAYLASSNGDAGGICQKNVDIQGVKKSLNCGIVTIINYGSRSVDLVTQIAFLHEVGHSFGSSHDPATCQPGDSNGGNYIMYYSASSGTKANNKVFSSCSLDTMGPVFNYVATNNYCFQTSTAPICGNGIVETGETCDCGFPTDCTDRCCNSSLCQLNSGFSCSPSQGACCESDCSFSQVNKVCAGSTDCKSNSVCTGTSAICQSASTNSNSPNLTACNGGTQVCLSGECTGSICQRYSLTQCYLTGDLSVPTVDKFSLCHLACTGTATNNVCTDSFNISVIVNDISTGIVLKPGSVCNNNLGYCDALSKCRTTNLNTLTSKLIASLLTPKKTIADVKTWVMTYWWAVLIFVIIFLVIFNIVIYCLSKTFPTSNPNKNLQDIKKKTDKTGQTSRHGTDFRRRSQIFTTEISDNIDYERPVPVKKTVKQQRILV